jgi:primary-amine oxidase
MSSARRRLKLATRLLAAAGLWLLLPANASAQSCSAPFLVTLNSNGTSWRFCWEMRQREGLVINFADYQAAGDAYKRVLFRGSLAQVHVPYFPGSPRFHDLTTSTSGLGAGALNLTNTDCAPANRLSPQVCREFHDRGLAWKFGNLSLRGSAVTVWMSSQLGQYNYILSWTFNDDGSFEPQLAFTGRLQIVDAGSQFAPFGTPVDAPGLNRFARNHVHSMYFRLDFDIVTSANNGVESQYYSPYTDPNPDFPTCQTLPGWCGTSTTVPWLTEGSDVYGNGLPFTSWRIYNQGITNANGRSVGYELTPESSWAWYGEPTNEPWSQADFWVTQYDFCEQLAVDNFPPYIDASCSGAAPDVDAMSSRAGDISAGADVVVWYKTAFEHLTREEDQVNMPIEIRGVTIQPRSWRHHSTLEP